MSFGGSPHGARTAHPSWLASAGGLLGRGAEGVGPTASAGRIQPINEGEGSYQVVEELVWVGPGRGDFSPTELKSARAEAVEASPDCVNSPEDIARGAPFFRRGVVCIIAFKATVTCMVVLLLVGIGCLVASFVHPLGGGGAAARAAGEAGHAHRRGTLAAPPAPAPAPAGPGSGCEDLAPAPAGDPIRKLGEVLLAPSAAAGAGAGASAAQAAAARLAERRRWCCENELIGCPDFNCESDLAAWAIGWSTAKQRWCCEHQHTGCPVEG